MKKPYSKTHVCATCKKEYPAKCGSQKYCSEQCKPWSQRKIWKEGTKENLIAKYGNVCSYCGRELDGLVVHIDHILPTYHEGTDDESNLTLSCRACNMIKGQGPIGWLLHFYKYIRSEKFHSPIIERLGKPAIIEQMEKFEQMIDEKSKEQEKEQSDYTEL